METASEELTDEFLLFMIKGSGLLQSWAQTFPDPRGEPEISMEVLFTHAYVARLPGLFHA